MNFHDGGRPPGDGEPAPRAISGLDSGDPLQSSAVPAWWRRPALSAAGRAALAEGLPELAESSRWPVLVPVPEYGSPAWHQLDEDDPARHAAVVRAADCWLALTSSPHVADLIAEWIEWDVRRVDAEASHAISGAGNRVDGRGRPLPSVWRLAANAPSFKELQRRRAEPGCAVRCPVCSRVRTCWPVPASPVCDRCAARAGAAA